MEAVKKSNSDFEQFLDADIDSFDASEFDIPEIEKPTLESILNEPEDDYEVAEDIEDGGDGAAKQALVANASDDTVSINADNISISSQDHRRYRSPAKTSKNIRYQRHGSVLRQVALKSISSQMISANERVDSGLPTAICVSTLIAVGTSHGLVLVFDSAQVLKWMLGSVAVGKQYGAVSALTFNRETDRLLCGFARGQMTMWNLIDGKLLRTITDAHPPGSAILSVKFTDDHTLALCSDSAGCVYQLDMKRSSLGVRSCDSRCLFSGARGEVCCMEPLHMPLQQKNHPLRGVILLCMATLSKVLVITLKPTQKLVFMVPFKGDPSTLPLIAWQFVIIQVNEQERVLDPVLAVARDQTICFYQVLYGSGSNNDEIRFAQLQKTEVTYKLLSIQWMNSRTLVALDVSERAHVIDVRTEEELEVIDATQAQLVYSTSFYKSLATGGNVSQALAFAGERSCFNSITAYNGQVVLLGRKGVHVVTIRAWNERVDILVKQKKYIDALKLAASFFDAHAKAVVGLPGKAAMRRQLVSYKMVEMLCEFIDFAMNVATSQTHRSHDDLLQHFQNVVPAVVEYCLKLGRQDLLFEQIYDRLASHPVAVGVLLESLEPFILTDRLTSVTPAIMQHFVEHYKSRGLLRNVEACIVHMEISSLDIHQVFVLCWEHGLYDAIIHVYNKGMRDYTTPLDELMAILNPPVLKKKQLSEEQISLGNKILVYVSCCLSGRAYPIGDLDQNEAAHVRDQVFKAITCLHTKDHSEEELSYPHLRTLLHFDCREFINVLAMSFDELDRHRDSDSAEKKQRVVDILLYIMVENNIDFSALQVGILFTFLARQMARENNTIMVSRALFEQVLDALCVPCEVIDSRHEERQQALLELIQAGGLEHVGEDRLIEAAEAAKFFQVCENLYKRRRAYDKILSCYWMDPLRKPQAFTYIQHVLMNNDLTQEEKNKVQKEAMNHLVELVLINATKAARLVCIGFSILVSDVEKLLKDEPRALYRFLSAIFEVNKKTGSPLYVDRQLHIDEESHERYIAMMCEREPERVNSYLHGAENYRVDQILEIVKEKDITDAHAYLLEAKGDIEGAFDVLFAKFKVACTKFNTESTTGGMDKLVDVRLHLMKTIELLQRHAGKLAEEKRQTFWFPILDDVMKIQRHATDDLLVEETKSITGLVLNNMMSQISLSVILSKVMQDPAYSGGKFGEVKELILGMLDTYNYEKTLLHTCTNLVHHDLYRQLEGLTKTVNKPVLPKSPYCDLCEYGLYSEDGKEVNKQSILCFRCGHSYHMLCLKRKLPPRQFEGKEYWMCPLCNKSVQSPALTTRMQRSSSSSSSHPIGDHDDTQIKTYQLQALENLRKNQKTQSRLALLTELSKQNSGRSSHMNRQSIFENENFQLRTAARYDVESYVEG